MVHTFKVNAVAASQRLQQGVADRKTARSDGTSCPAGRGLLGGNLGPLTRGLTTAFIKGLNSIFSDVKRKARGYRMVGNMSAVLYLVDGKLTQPCC